MEDRNTVSRTFDDWNSSFIARAMAWLKKSKGNEYTKLGYALSRVVPKVQKALEKEQRKHNARLERLRISLCLTDEKGKVLYKTSAPTEYEFERSKLSELYVEAEKLVEELYETKIEIKPYFATDIPAFLFHYGEAFKRDVEPLTGAEQEAFEGVVIPEGAAASALTSLVTEERKEAAAVS